MFTSECNAHLSKYELGNLCEVSKVTFEILHEISYPHIDRDNFCTVVKFEELLDLTHWGRATHICASKIIIIGSDNGLLPGRHQAIITPRRVDPFLCTFSESHVVY